MTLPPEKIGDKGQRYVVWCRGYPGQGWNRVAYTDDFQRGDDMGRTMLTAPGCQAYQVEDRQALNTSVSVQEKADV